MKAAVALTRMNLSNFFKHPITASITASFITFVATLILTSLLPNLRQAVQNLFRTTDSYRVHMATSTVNLVDIFKAASDRLTYTEQGEFLKPYFDKPVMASAIFRNIDKNDSGYRVDAEVKGYLITCAFPPDSDTERKLNILRNGDRFSFVGIFKNGSVYGGGQSIQECYLLI